MKARTVRDLGGLVRSSRRTQGLTQAELASRLGVSREWVVRLEGGHPRLEAQKVLDALSVLGLLLEVSEPLDTSLAGPPKKAASPQNKRVGGTAAKKAPSKAVVRSAKTGRVVSTTKGRADPFDSLFSRRSR